MEKTKKIYLMSAGTLLPAFVGTAAYMAIKKQAKLNMTNILIFAALSIAGGYFTAKMLKE
jgi:hypothetical protein